MRPLSGIFNISGVCILSTGERVLARASKQRYVKIEESDLFHFRTFIQLCDSNFYIVTSRYAICSAVIICASLWWHVKMMICPG